jgi:hypothetical protein
MGDRNYSLGGMEGINIDENNQITVCFEFEEATMTMSMETLLNELHPEMFSFFPNLFQKIGGAVYESGAMSLISEWTSGWDRGLLYIPSTFVGNVFYSRNIQSILLLILEKTIIPEKLKENDVIYDGTELLEKYIHNKYGKPYETLGKSIKEDGIFKGGAKGLGRLAVEYEIDKGNLAANAVIYDGEVVASLLNKIPGVNIDMSAFQEASAYVDKYISYDKAEEITKEYFLEPLANTFQNIISFKNHKHSSDNGVEHSGGHTGSGRHY